MSGSEAWLKALAERLHPLSQAPAAVPWNQQELDDLLPAELMPAAVLVALVPRAEQLTVLLTRRTTSMRQHAGQIAFPGGRIDPQDSGAVAAALREAEEEVGLAPSALQPLGFLDPYATITGFRVLPVVASLGPQYQLRLAPDEVDEAFEVPLPFLLDPANSEQVAAEFRGRLRHYWQFRFGRHHIWGATAAMLLNLRRFVDAEPALSFR